MRKFAIPFGIVCTLGLLFALFANGGKLLIQGFGPEPADIVEGVPLGSKVSSLDRYLEGEVQEGDATVSSADTEGEVSYRTWKATRHESSEFTGEITFIDQGFFSSEVYTFKYVNGLLVEKDWGFLPG